MWIHIRNILHQSKGVYDLWSYESTKSQKLSRGQKGVIDKYNFAVYMLYKDIEKTDLINKKI
jgi:hypothetical protein